MVARHVRPLDKGLELFAFEAACEALSIAPADAEHVVVGRAGRRATQVLAMLHASPGPVPARAVFASVGHGALPKPAFYVGRGLIGLPQHVQNFERWAERVVPAAIDVMTTAPNRQWSTRELLSTIAERVELPDWLTQWHVAAMLRLDSRVRYLGKLRVALDASTATRQRMHLHDALVDIVRAAPAPIRRDDLLAIVRRTLACSDDAFAAAALHAPLLAVDEHRIGLLDRDLPGGRAAIAAAVDALCGELERRGDGLTSREAVMFVHGLGGAYSTWSSQIVRAVARQSGRCCINHSGSIGFATWPSDLLPSPKRTSWRLLRNTAAAYHCALRPRH